MTNAEKIRSLSDEELALALYRVVCDDPEVRFCEEREECIEDLDRVTDENCMRRLLAWLLREEKA